MKSAGQAASYYESDDYDSEGGEAPSAWFGAGADELDLKGEVDRKAFARGLEGELPDGQKLGTVRNGEREHRPGWDVTFSAPKSVSIMAEVAGDRRLIAAHDKAVTREEARHTRGYEPGDVVTFRRDYDRHGIEKGQAYRVERIDRDGNRIELRDREGRAIDWRLDKWGRGQAETFTEQAREFARGDRVQFTRDDREAGRINGATATVTAIDVEARTMTVKEAKGREHVMQLDQAGDRHVRHGWVGTVHGSQGATADRSMTHLESFRANTVDAKSAYVCFGVRSGTT